MSRIGIFGGSFNPVHHGHLITALSVLEKRKLDKIIFMPCFISPHKVQQNENSPESRLEMLRLAVEDFPAFGFSDFEIRAGGVSYTVDTLRALKKTFDEIELIIGYDNLLVFDKWKEPEEIINLAKLVVLKRKVDSEGHSRNQFFSKAVFVDSLLIEISSSDIRRRVKENLPINFLVPQKVMEYIYQLNLYK